jgi:hypothetical protein
MLRREATVATIKISDPCQRNFHYSERFPSAPKSRKFTPFFFVSKRAQPSLAASTVFIT